jgi:hypothetical protein
MKTLETSRKPKAKTEGRNFNPVWAWGLAAFAITVVGVGFYSTLHHKWNTTQDPNLAYTTTGIVKAKEKFVISTEEPYYINDLGDRIPKDSGTEQFRLYYQINNFDQVPEAQRSALIASEIKRVQVHGLRFRNYYAQDMREYDRAEIGDELQIHFKVIGDEKEILSIENLTHPVTSP